MRKIDFRFFASILLVAMIFSACGLGKMVKNYPNVKYEVTPKVLETQGGKIAVAIKGQIPEKYFNKRATMNITPVLKYEGGSTELKPVNLQGEKAKGNGTVINYKTGGSFSYNDVITYDPKMNSSDLTVNPVIAKVKSKETVKADAKRAEVKANPKSIALGDRKIGDGVLYTSERYMVDPDVMGITPEVAKKFNMDMTQFYEKETFVEKEAKIYFVVDMFNLNMKYALNKDQAAKDKLDTLAAFLKKGWKIKDFSINAWASPEGEEKHNTTLSDERSKTGKKYVYDLYLKWAKEAAKAIKAKFREKNFKFDEIVKVNVNARGEDWDGFVKAVETSTIKDKNVILNVIRAQNTPEAKQKEMRKMTVVYKEIEDQILPPLRRAEFNVTCYLPKKTDEQILRLARTNPDSLDNKELFYAASLTKDAGTQLKIFQDLSKFFPKDWKGFNNAAELQIKNGDLKEAAANLDKANTLSPNNPLVLNNLGAVSAMNKDFAAADSYFKQASKLGVSEDYNSGILIIPKGDYKNAQTMMSGKKCNYNVALVQLIAGNTAGASSTLECAEKTPEVLYLQAVVGARTSNKGMVIDNLKKAIAAKPAYKAQAKDDREFISYFNDGDFQALVK